MDHGVARPAGRPSDHAVRRDDLARGDDTEASDIDLLVDLAPGTGLLGLIGLQRELAELLGKEVDLVPASGLKADVRDVVLAEAIDL